MTFLALAAAVGAMCADVAEPVIDIHLHSYDRDPRFAARVPNPVTGELMTATNGAAHARATVEMLQRTGVVRGVVAGQSSATDDRMIALDPDRLRAGFAVDNIPSAAELEEIRARHAAGRLAMIGEVSYQYEGIAHDDPRLEPLWALAEELDVPIAVHSGSGPPGTVYQGSPRHRARLGSPLGLEEALARHPRMKLIVLHGGWPFFDDTVALMRSYPQIYLELGAIDWAEPGFNEYLRRLVEFGFGKRILFGSDQMVWPEAIVHAVERHRAAHYLTPDQRRDILFGNAVNLFGWDDLKACGT